MRMRMTLSDGPQVEQLEIWASTGTRWGAVARALPPGWPRQPHRYAARSPVGSGAGLTPMGADEVVGEVPLLHGCTVVLHRGGHDGAADAEPLAGQGRPGDSGHWDHPSTHSDHPLTGLPKAASTSPAEIRVSEGPDCGWLRRLSAGATVTVGREPACDLVLADPSLSRRHCSISATRGGVVVSDVGSTNGCRLDGEEVTTETPWSPGQRLHIGASVLELVIDQPVPLQVRPDGEGRLVVTPTPRTGGRAAAQVFESPAAPEPPQTSPPPVLSWTLPLLVSLALAVVLRMPMFLLFGLMAPAMMLGSHFGDRRAQRKHHARACTRHIEEVAGQRRALQRAIQAEVAQLRELHPDLAAWSSTVRERPSHPLWAGRAPEDDLTVRLGRGSCATSVTRDGEAVTAPSGPILLHWTGTVGVVGPPALVRALARGLALQVLLDQPPHVLHLGPVSAPTRRLREWDWLTWSPHRDPRGQPHSLSIEDRLDDEDPPPGHPPAGYVLRIARSRQALGWVDHVVVVLDATTACLDGGDQGPALAFAPDLLSRSLAARLVRRIAPLRTDAPDVGAGRPPSAVRLDEVLDGTPDARSIQRRWTASPRSTESNLGLNASGVVSVDLAADGPHALVAGTTGAGKSELLRTLVTTLALGNRPDEVVFVLVDYKGGAAFADCARLPHCVGMVTDLDPHLADRALTSLGAELTRRERLLAGAGAQDLESYQRSPGRTPIPRLVIVIDEFRALAEELPAFVPGLVRIAALGRSLGVHLVLATQRPAGIVSADVRANVNLRIALRLRDTHDSLDVLDSPEAAHLPEGVPGRALLRTGTDPPREVQVARVAGPRDRSSPSVQVRQVTDLWDVGAPPSGPEGGVRGCDPTSASTEDDDLLVRLVQATCEASTRMEITPPPSPWLAPLPDRVTVSALGGSPPPAAYAVPWGLLDLPGQQRQVTAWWQPVTDGHFAVVGSPRSGATTVLRTLATGLLDAHDAGRVHLTCFDSGTGLRALAEAPHTSAWVGAEDAGRGLRVLQRLAETVSERQRSLADAGLTSFAEQQQAVLPWPLVTWFVDGWGRFAEAQGEHARGAGLDAALRLLKEGPAVGVVAVVSGDRALLTGRVAAVLPRAWALRLTDPTDLLLAGLTQAQIPGWMPPGRVIGVRDAVVAHVGVPSSCATGEADPSGAAQVSAVRETLRRHHDRDSLVTPAARPWRVVELPAVCHLTDLLRKPRTKEGPVQGLVVGVGGDEATPFALGVDLVRGGSALVVGPPRSGRTTTLRTVAAAAGAAGHQVVWVDADTRADPAALPDLLAAAETGTAILVCVDDVEMVADSMVEDTVLEWASRRGATGGALVVAADVTRAATAYRGLVPLAARTRTGILLSPRSAADGAVLGVSPPTGGLARPGRGVLVRRGTTTPLQVALPPAGE